MEIHEELTKNKNILTDNFQKNDKNGDGFLDFDEFMQIAGKLDNLEF